MFLDSLCDSLQIGRWVLRFRLSCDWLRTPFADHTRFPVTQQGPQQVARLMQGTSPELMVAGRETNLATVMNQRKASMMIPFCTFPPLSCRGAVADASLGLT